MTTSQYLFAIIKAILKQSCTSELQALLKNAVSLQITKYVEREIMNHRSLMHPHIVQFKEVRDVCANTASIACSEFGMSACTSLPEEV